MALIQITDVGPKSSWKPEEVVGLVLDVPLQHIQPDDFYGEGWSKFAVREYASAESAVPIASCVDWNDFVRSIFIYPFKYRILFREPGDKKPCA